jgi:type VI protein secretion system component VasK
MSVMSKPDRSDDAPIADTGMFRRFVDSEANLAQQEETASRSRLWLWIAVVAAIIVVLVVLWLLLR